MKDADDPLTPRLGQQAQELRLAVAFWPCNSHW